VNMAAASPSWPMKSASWPSVARIAEIDSTARGLRDQAAVLEGLVGNFTLEESDQAAFGAPRKLAPPRAAARTPKTAPSPVPPRPQRARA
jgi:hypothetical protein